MTKRHGALKRHNQFSRKQIFRGVFHGLLICLGLSLILLTTPYVYKGVWGNEITSEVLNQVGQNITDPNKLAMKIYSLEQQNFMNLYFIRPENLSRVKKLLASYGFYRNRQGELHLFRPFNVFSVPPEWVLHSKLANCREYAEVFVYLMSKKGVKARVVRAPGEDHTWAEYYVGKYKIIFDPSNPYNPVIVNPKSFGQNKNFSYVEAYDLFNPEIKEDVSDEYISRGRLVVQVLKDGKPVEGAEVQIQSTYLMEKFPERYNGPRLVLSDFTAENGTVQFKLGSKEYKIVSRKCSLLACWKGEGTGKLVVGSTTCVRLELDIDYLRTGIYWALIILLAGITGFNIHKRYVHQRQNDNGGPK